MARPTLLPLRRGRTGRTAGTGAGSGTRSGPRRRAIRLASLPVAALPVAAPLAFPLVAVAGVVANPVVYVVQPGDTLGGIALRLRTDVATLARLNHLTDPDVLLAGTPLLVPPPVARVPAPPTASVVSYTVKPGDTIWDIATRTGTTVAAVLAANHLTEDARIRPGQVLLLPGAHLPGVPPRPRPKPVAPVAVHVVQPGETVSGIAAHYHLSVEAVLRANRLTADAVIRPGRKLVLPGVRIKQAVRPVVPPTHAYVVRRGDTLSGIAAAAHVPLVAVTALNHVNASDVIFPGQRLLLPGPVSSGQAPSGRPLPAVAPGETAAIPPPAAARLAPTATGEAARRAAVRTSPMTTPQASAADAVRIAAAANRGTLARRPAPAPRRVRALITATARRFGVDPSLALAVAAEESGFDQRRVSSANAVGVMQVVPSSGRWAAALVGRRLDLLDAADNIEAGVALLAALRSAAPEDLSVAAYYQGLTSVRSRGMYADTRRYVADVLTLRERYR